jgi:tetratricopeptide (TPR) repeat protein
VERNGTMTILRNRAHIFVALLIVWSFPVLNAQDQAATNVAVEYSRAEALVRNHQWDEGLAILGPVLEQEPRNLKALNLAGIACAAKGDTQKASRYFERSLVVDPHFVPALRTLSINEFNTQEYASAEKHLMVAQAQLPDDPTINLYLGQIAYRQQNYKVAAERLDHARSLLSHYPLATAALAVSFLRSDQKPKALELLGQINPSDLDAQSQLELGVALAETENNAQAISYLQAAFDHNPESYDAGFDLALACVRAKSYATAITTIQDILHLGHDNSELENLFAEALEGQGETGKAIEAYRSAIMLDPNDENNYVDFASLCIDHHAFEDGMKVITLGLHLHPDSERLTFMRGILDASKGDVDLAEKDFEDAARFAPQRDLGAVGLGALSLQKGNSGEAIKVIRRQLIQKPMDPSLLYMLGKALITSGSQPGQPSYAEAQQVLEKSVTLNPNLCLPHISLGSIYLQEDRFAEAAAQFEAARSIDPNENSAYSHLAVAYRHLGQAEKAKEILTALQELLAQQRSGVRVKSTTSSTGRPEKNTVQAK